MQLAQPELDFLMSKCNQDHTSDGLQGMGRRLAAETVQYLQVLASMQQTRKGKTSQKDKSVPLHVIMRGPVPSDSLGHMQLCTNDC